MQPDIAYHNTKLNNIVLRNIKQTMTPRPRGLWYSRGSIWINFVQNNPTYGVLYNNIFQLDLSCTNIFIIDNIEDYIYFTKKFIITNGEQINWPSVACEYDGVEINNQDLINKKLWSSLWNVSSGCIWNTTNLSLSMNNINLNNFISDKYIIKKSLEYNNPEIYIDDIYKCGKKIGGGLLIDPKSIEWTEFFKKYNTIDGETRKINARRNLLRNNHLKTKLSLKEKLSALPDIIKSFSTEEVGYEQMLKRLDVCTNCDYLSNINNEPGCGVCGCPLNPNNKILNILAKKETSENFCKHSEGSQWKKNDC